MHAAHFAHESGDVEVDPAEFAEPDLPEDADGVEAGEEEASAEFGEVGFHCGI